MNFSFDQKILTFVSFSFGLKSHVNLPLNLKLETEAISLLLCTLMHLNISLFDLESMGINFIQGTFQ